MVGGTLLRSVLKLFLLERKLIGVYSLEMSIRLLGSQPVSALCSAIRPNREPLRGSVQFVPNSVSRESWDARRIGKQAQEIAMGRQTME